MSKITAAEYFASLPNPENPRGLEARLRVTARREVERLERERDGDPLKFTKKDWPEVCTTLVGSPASRWAEFVAGSPVLPKPKRRRRRRTQE